MGVIAEGTDFSRWLTEQPAMIKIPGLLETICNEFQAEPQPWVRNSTISFGVTCIMINFLLIKNW